jgi:hypothetical protein
VGTALLACGLLVAGSGTASADSGSAYSAYGQADGFFLTIKNSAIPLLSAIQGGGPTAQATLDSLDQSNAFASFPYPGQEEAGLPGLIGSVLGLPVPAYPAYVNTSYGQPAVSKDLTGVSLRASSTHASSTATAIAGGNGLTKAQSEVLSSLDSDDAVQTTAVATIDTFDLGGALSISNLRSVATASRDAKGLLTSTSRLSIGRISVPGLAVTLPRTANMCPVNQLPSSELPPAPCPPELTEVPLPAQFAGATVTEPTVGFLDGNFVVTLPGTEQKIPVPAATMLSALKAAGVDASYQEPRKLKNGIIAAGLVLRQTVPGSPVPVPENPVLNTPGPLEVTYTFGESVATVDRTSFESGVGAGSAYIPSTDGGAAAGAPGALLPQTSGLGALPELAGQPASAAGALPTGSSAPTLVAQREPRQLDSSNLYLVLAGAALLALGSTQVVRVVGVIASRAR